MRAIVETYLWKKIQHLKVDNHPFEKVGQLIQNNPRSFYLEKIARDACLSPSQFERKFQMQTGVTPKLFSRICRFYQAFELKARNPTLDWLSIAIRSGYTITSTLLKISSSFPVVFQYTYR